MSPPVLNQNLTAKALLEAMAEGQVSIEGATHPLDDLFFVIATQNPVEFRGAYPLPEAQMDRFAVRLSLGYGLHCGPHFTQGWLANNTNAAQT